MRIVAYEKKKLVSDILIKRINYKYVATYCQTFKLCTIKVLIKILPYF